MFRRVIELDLAFTVDRMGDAFAEFPEWPRSELRHSQGPPMKIVVVAMPNSIHVARWLASVRHEGWSIHVFPSNAVGHSHDALRDVTVHHFFRAGHPGGLRERGIRLFHRKIAHTAERLVDRVAPGFRAEALARLIRREQPDIVHSMEFQHSAYLTLRARDLIGGTFPRWIVTNWGNDIYHFRQFPEHEAPIRRLLSLVDAYTCECERDVVLANEMGFAGTVFPPFPNAGGFDLDSARQLRAGNPSTRRVVMLKGYQHYAGRALTALRAVESCKREMQGYRLCIYSATRDVESEARAMAGRTGIGVDILRGDRAVPHEEMLRLHGAARTSIGLSISDGVSTSFLEALVMGSFPIQSWTACANEWIEDGETGILAPPDDADATADALRRALTDDRLVDAAAERNWVTAQARLDAKVLSGKAAEIYRAVVAAPKRDAVHGGQFFE